MQKSNLTNSKNFDSKKTTFKLVLFLIVVIFFVVKCNWDSSELEKTKTYKKLDALIFTETFVKGKLKSPSSAEFESSTDGITKINDSTFTVIGAVNSQNSFGAMLRSKYSCKIIFSPKTETYVVEDFILE